MEIKICEVVVVQMDSKCYLYLVHRSISVMHLNLIRDLVGKFMVIYIDSAEVIWIVDGPRETSRDGSCWRVNSRHPLLIEIISTVMVFHEGSTYRIPMFNITVRGVVEMYTFG